MANIVKLTISKQTSDHTIIGGVHNLRLQWVAKVLKKYPINCRFMRLPVVFSTFLFQISAMSFAVCLCSQIFSLKNPKAVAKQNGNFLKNIQI